MIKLSTRGRYGVRLMLDLALHNNKERSVSLKEIADRQGVSEKYLWQLISPLKHAGLIQSCRGLHGGYQLSKDPKDITLREIIEVLEGNFALVPCVAEPSDCARMDFCVVQEVWGEINQRIEKIFESYTLEDIIQKYRARIDAASYVI